MRLPLALVILGVMAYAVTFVSVSRQGGATSESWLDWVLICAVPLVLLLVILCYDYIEDGGRTSAMSALRGLFEPEPNTILPYFGCVALGFIVPASMHLLLRKLRAAWRHDA